MIVTKPQFDENELGEGTPVQLCISSKKEKDCKTNWNGIVVGFTPLKLKVAGYTPKWALDIEIVEISIEQVLKEKVSIEKLVRPVSCTNFEEASTNE
ncbi:hypothetical protein FC677_22875 [Bacillus cereus]|uniref:hypothetical protein n=1 Tax=Bacillus cereus TaxID=1396 RepID=UPI0010BD45FE|nr:hypothetical protein [Bacillus cereus]TKH52910.1 hypothetical protein FC677_22875 [Bacillus cereus]HDR7710378.1 hypothetical protein [Bacillus cereus]